MQGDIEIYFVSFHLTPLGKHLTKMELRLMNFVMSFRRALFNSKENLFYNLYLNDLKYCEERVNKDIVV